VLLAVAPPRKPCSCCDVSRCFFFAPERQAQEQNKAELPHPGTAKELAGRQTAARALTFASSLSGPRTASASLLS